MTKSIRGGTAGFTIIELMVGMVCAAILVLAISAVFYGYYGAWLKTSAEAALQSDASFAMDIISRAVREAAYSSITAPANESSPGSTLTIGGRSFNVAALAGLGVNAASASFSKNGALQSVTADITLQRQAQQRNRSLGLNFTVSCRN